MTRLPEPSRQRRRVALRIAASAAALAVVVGLVDPAAVAQRLATAEPLWLLMAGLALTLQTVLSAVRWRLTAARLGQQIGLGRAVSEYYVGQLVNQTLPGGVLGDLGRAVRARHDGGLLRAGLAVALERLAGQAALLGVAVVAVTATALVPGGVAWPGAAAVVACSAAVAALAATAALPALCRRAGFTRLDALLADAWHALAAPDVRHAQLALSLGTVACNIAAFAFCARATGTALSPIEAVALVPVALLAMLIPLAVSGWGFREGAASALWPLAAATPEAGVAASVAFGGTLLVASLPGLLPILAAPRGRAGASR